MTTMIARQSAQIISDLQKYFPLFLLTLTRHARGMDDLKAQWLQQCLHLAGRPSSLWPHERKILRNQRMTFVLDNNLSLDDIGYTDLKAGALERLYLHQESREAALVQWRQRKKGKFTSVGFHTFNHLTKRSGIVGMQGPCMIGVAVTDTGREVSANVAYRSTECCKKLPADLIFLRDVLLSPFGVTTVTINFANVTAHPLYFPILFPLLEDPVGELRALQLRYPRFWRVVVREGRDLLCGGARNANFMQAQRVTRHVLAHTDRATLKELRAYLSSTQGVP